MSLMLLAGSAEVRHFFQ